VKTNRRSHKASQLSHFRWTSYAIAAGATAVAGMPTAEAEIHYSGDVSIKLAGFAQARLPLSNSASLSFINKDRGSTFWQDFDFHLKGAISGSARGNSYGFGDIFLSALPARVNVSAGTFYPVAGGHSGRGVLISNWSDGQFSPIGGSGRGFVGFRFNTGKGTQYGWARISTRDDIIDGRHHIRDLIKDYAWGDPGDAILTGQKQSIQSAKANSVLGSLGLLAFGAQGLEAWRTQGAGNSD